MEDGVALLSDSGSSVRPVRWSVFGAVCVLLFLVLSLSLSLSLSSSSASVSFACQRFVAAAVASDSSVCSEHATQLLRRGGTAADAAVAALLCLGVLHPHSSGLGGGSVFLVRTRSGNYSALDARETAPAASSVHMFRNVSSEKGPLSVAVPGELAGMMRLHALHGKLPWSTLFEQSAALAQDGFVVDRSLASAIQDSIANASSPLGALFFGKKEGDIVRRPDLAATLRQLASDPFQFRNGSVAAQFAADVGGILTLSDMASYRVRDLPVLFSYVFGRRVTTVGGAYGGPLLLQVLNTLEGLLQPWSVSSLSDPLFFHYFVESFKFAFANRLLLGDQDFENGTMDLELEMISKAHAALLRSKIAKNRTFPLQHYADLGNLTAPSRAAGTTHVSVVDKDGLAVSVTSTVNLFFGSGIMTKSGIIANDEMDDFSSPDRSNAFGFPPSAANYIAPGKRPLSSMTPTIVETETGTLGLVVGGSGGSRIVTGVCQAVLQSLFGADPGNSVGRPRVHDQLLPQGINLESLIPSSVANSLRDLGHTVIPRGADFADAVVQMIQVTANGVLAACDWRKQGKVNVPCVTAGF